MILVVSTECPNKIALALSHHYPGRYTAVSGSAWIVATRATTREVSDRLGISEGKNGSGLAVEIESYWGLASADLWVWITENRQR